MADLKGPKPTLGLSLLGFKYSYRHGLFDWRLLHGIDVDAVVSHMKERHSSGNRHGVGDVPLGGVQAGPLLGAVPRRFGSRTCRPLRTA